MEWMTLREIDTVLGVSRRAVQGYEKAGIVIPSGRNERGYLLYDEKTQERISRIKLYQQLGFKIKEIKWLIDAPGTEVRPALEKQIIKLGEERVQKEILIKKAYDLISIL